MATRSRLPGWQLAFAGAATLLLPALLADSRSPRPALIYPNGIAFDAAGTLHIADIGAHRIWKATRSGALTPVAGTGEPGFSGDGGAALKAQFFSPQDLVFEPGGALIVVDTLNHRLRRIDSRGILATIAGTGVSGYSGDGGPALKAQLNGPQAAVFDPQGNLYIADTYNHVVRRIDKTGAITTIAGSEPGLSGDGGPATKAQISLPTDVAIGADGSVYITEGGNSRIRHVGADGIIQTIAGFGPGSGLGGAGFAGDGGPAEKGKLFAPASLVFGKSGVLYVSDCGNNRIRVIQDGQIKTAAGNGETGDFNTPQKIRLSRDGRLFIADRGNSRVQVWDPGKGIVRTVTGSSRARGITVSSDF